MANQKIRKDLNSSLPKKGLTIAAVFMNYSALQLSIIHVFSQRIPWVVAFFIC